MSHWLKRALVTAALASGAMIVSAGAAEAAPEGRLPVDPVAIITQTQDALNNNTTTQDADSSAETIQVNLYAPVAVLSADSNNGDVDQSNEAETTSVAKNENESKQSVAQSQTARDQAGCGKCQSGGGTDQSQTAGNDNATEQDAAATAETKQVNVYAPVAVFSDGSNNGDVDQSNQADTTAVAGNHNDSEQTIDQDQTATVEDGDGWSCGKCGSNGNADQTQNAANTNQTDQDANATATTDQTNQVDGADPEKSKDRSGKGHSYDRKGGGDVDQSNQADTTAVAGNHNDSEQTIDQDQTATVEDGDGGWHKPHDRDGKDDHGKSDKGKRDKPHDRDGKDDHGKSDKGKRDKPHDRDRKDGCDDARKAKSKRGAVSQSQEAGNTNSTTQTANASAATRQLNHYAPLALFSRGSNGGEVDQANTARTKALASNGNGALQSIRQVQGLDAAL